MLFSGEGITFCFGRHREKSTDPEQAPPGVVEADTHFCWDLAGMGGDGKNSPVLLGHGPTSPEKSATEAVFHHPARPSTDMIWQEGTRVRGSAAPLIHTDSVAAPVLAKSPSPVLLASQVKLL